MKQRATGDRNFLHVVTLVSVCFCVHNRELTVVTCGLDKHQKIKYTGVQTWCYRIIMNSN